MDRYYFEKDFINSLLQNFIKMRYLLKFFLIYADRKKIDKN